MHHSRCHWAAVRIQKIARGVQTRIKQGMAFATLLKLRPNASTYLSFSLSTSLMLNQKKNASKSAQTLSGVVSFAMYHLIFSKEAEESIKILEKAWSKETFREQPLFLYLMATVTQLLYPNRYEKSKEIA